MSIKALNWAFSLTLKPTEKLTLIALADHADVHGECWPRHRTIAAKTGLSTATIRRAIDSLAEAGYMRKEAQHRDDGSQSSNRYWLNIPADPTEQPRAHSYAPRAHSEHPSTIIETPKNHQKNISAPVATLPDWVPVDAWTGYLELRKRKRAPLTERALSLAVKELEKLRGEGFDPGEVLDQSTLKGWVGLFPLKAKPAEPMTDGELWAKLEAEGK